MTQQRHPQGVPVGGQFAASTHAEADVTLEAPEDRPPLQDWDIVGFTRKIYSPAPEVQQPGGSCWHCGAALINCVQVRNRNTGEVVDVGMDCAERAGKDQAEIRAMMREKFAEQRAADSRARSAAWRAEEAAKEAQRVADFGEHGTETRYGDGGCRCDECRTVAPHGTLDRLEGGGCYCEKCVDAAVASEQYIVDERTVLLDAQTGHEIEGARLVSTRYGLSWVVDHEGADSQWYSFSPKRRSTSLKKGVLEAEVPCLIRKGRYSDYKIAHLEEPSVDSWGEPIVRKSA